MNTASRPIGRLINAPSRISAHNHHGGRGTAVGGMRPITAVSNNNPSTTPIAGQDGAVTTTMLTRTTATIFVPAHNRWIGDEVGTSRRSVVTSDRKSTRLNSSH